MSIFGAVTARERNADWSRAPIRPPGLKQRNICINVQPEDFKSILKDGLSTLHRNCAFNLGYYLPVDIQTRSFVQLIVESANKLNKPHYATRLRRDTVLQKEVCDLVSPYFVPLTQTLIRGVLRSVHEFHTIARPSSRSHSIWSHMDMDSRTTSRHGQDKLGNSSRTTRSSLRQLTTAYVFAAHR